MTNRLEVQVFGVKKSAETRKALRFFAERRVRTHFVDFKVRGPSLGELRRFAQRFGVRALVDEGAKAFRNRGLHVAHMNDDRMLNALVQEPMMLRLPLVRWEQKLTVGAAEDTWKAWVEGR